MGFFFLASPSEEQDGTQALQPITSDRFPLDNARLAKLGKKKQLDGQKCKFMRGIAEQIGRSV